MLIQQLWRSYFIRCLCARDFDDCFYSVEPVSMTTDRDGSASVRYPIVDSEKWRSYIHRQILLKARQRNTTASSAKKLHACKCGAAILHAKDGT
jgi:hypothetical protein